MLRTYSVSILCNSSVLNYSNLEFATCVSLLNHPLACYRHFGAFLHGQTCNEVSLQLKVNYSNHRYVGPFMMYTPRNTKWRRGLQGVYTLFVKGWLQSFLWKQVGHIQIGITTITLVLMTVVYRSYSYKPRITKPTSKSVHLEKLCLNFSSYSFEIRVSSHHPQNSRSFFFYQDPLHQIKRVYLVVISHNSKSFVLRVDINNSRRSAFATASKHRVRCLR